MGMYRRNSADSLARVGREPVEHQTPGEREPVVPPRVADLTGLASFTLDAEGLVATWSMTAEHLFGQPASAAVGRPLSDVLMAGPQQGQLLQLALTEVAAWRTWTGTMAVAVAGGVRDITVCCEPLTGPGAGTLVIARLSSPQAGPSLLSEAVARIGSTLDLTQTAREAVNVAVPGFADAAAVYVPERMLAADELGSYQGRHVAVVRRLAAQLAGHPPEVTENLLRSGEVLVLGEGTPCVRAMAMSTPVLYDHLDVDTAERLGRRPGGREITASYTSFLAIPLVARGAVVGCAAFGRTATRADFGPDDVVLAAELASRAAVCIDNARLYDRERRTALALQSSLLPGRPQVPAGLEVAHCYLPVGSSMIGGDWHDIIPLPDGKAALIVGDAMGHGPEAAAVMVQLRTAAHILADLGLPPEQVLHRLDRMASGLSAPFATCIYTVIDPAASSCVTAQAGHLPPVLALPGAQPRLLDLPPGLPLGLVAGSFQASQISLPPGATLALYTDGLVESRTRPLSDGMAALCDALGTALAQADAPLSETCEAVTDTMREYGEDDITLVLARIRR